MTRFALTSCEQWDANPAGTVVYESEWNEDATPAQHADAVAHLVPDADVAILERVRGTLEADYVVTRVDALVYVIAWQNASGAIVDLELLDRAPAWERLPGQTLRVGYVNGGDSSSEAWPTRDASPEECAALEIDPTDYVVVRTTAHNPIDAS